MNYLTDVIPAKNRKHAYAVFALIGITLGAAQVAFVSLGSAQPDWLNVALSVYAFIGGAFGMTANANTFSE